jgi:hypothetical protein
LHPLQLQPAICSERISAVRNDQIGLLGQMSHHAQYGSLFPTRSERGAGGQVVVSKEEVAVGRKGSGGAWGSTSRNAGLAKMVEYEHWQKIKPKCRSSGCGLQFGDAGNDLLAIRLQSSKTLFSAARTSNSRCLVPWSKYAMRVIFF